MLREIKRLTVIFIVFLIIFSFVNQILTSKVKAEYLAEETEETGSTRIGLIGRLIRLFVLKEMNILCTQEKRLSKSNLRW